MDTQRDIQSLQGFPHWTDIGQKTGLDHLAMLRPSEALYQSLLPGISTITLRLRYYSFFPWILAHYSNQKRHTGDDVFRTFQRRCELLYALIAMHGTADENGTKVETGVTGANWASRRLKETKAEIDFGWGADVENSSGYLQNKAGALGAIYGPQLKEMKLTESAQKHDISLVSEHGKALAAALDQTLGPLSESFFALVERGTVTVTELETLSALKPSRIPPGSQEQRLLIDALFGLQGENDAYGIARRLSLLQLLRFTDLEEAYPSPDDAKWAWYGSDSARVLNPTAREDLKMSLALWRLYHTNDLLRIAYEAILKRSVDLLAQTDREDIFLESLLAQLLNEVPDLDMTWAAWLDVRADALTEERPEHGLVEKIEAAGAALSSSDPESLNAALSLIALLRRRVRDMGDLIDAGLPSSPHFQSLRTEPDFWASLGEYTASDALTRLFSERVIKRHLWVASRKMRNQRAYTYLLEVAEGRLRFRNPLAVGLSSPRISQALTFLEDAGLIGESGLTPDGRDLMERL